jgi:5-methyltetrahydropteroyltriglutamate--homocysteine methyltransferase
MRVSGRVTLQEPIFADHFRFLQSCVTTATPKLTVPSPSMLHYRGGRAAIDEDVYPDLDGFWADVTTAYADEVRALGELGCTYLQFDDTSLAYLNDPAQRDFVTHMGGDPAHLHEDYIRHINEALDGRPEGMTVTAHLCRGNFQSSWVAQGGYDYVAEALFNELGVDGLFLEYDDARSGGFEPLRFVPPGKVVVLGLVTTKRGDLESRDELKRRIEEASRFIDVDQLCLSGQCGFSSTVEGNALTHTSSGPSCGSSWRPPRRSGASRAARPGTATRAATGRRARLRRLPGCRPRALAAGRAGTEASRDHAPPSGT